MLTGGSSSSSGEDGGGGGNSNRLDANDPMRSNWCGSDWNDAIAHCSSDDHWCPSGSDADCPGGKICYAGTECKFIADLFPTASPTPAPSGSPTESPVIYGKIDNTRFCGQGWEDAQKTCQISTHCPSGANSECPGSQSCFGGINGCNIIDMQKHLKETGLEIIGSEQTVMESTSVEGSNSTTSILNSNVGVGNDSETEDNSLSYGTKPPAPSEFTLPQPTVVTAEAPSTSPRITPSPVVIDPNAHRPENHVFCGETWTDAMARCSKETFCSSGAQHVCESATDHCWVGITACDAKDWMTEAPVEIIPTPPPSLSPVSATPVTSAPAVPVVSGSTPAPLESIITTNETPDADGISVGQSYCAKSMTQLISQCATLSKCSGSVLCPSGFTCYSNVSCSQGNNDIAATPTDNLQQWVDNTSPPAPSTIFTLSPVMAVGFPPSPPRTSPPITSPPTTNPTKFTLSAEEVAQRFANENNYCGKSLGQILSSCSFSLVTCNDSTLCPLGTYCFGNIVCPDPSTKAPTISPSKATIITPQPSIAVDTTNDSESSVSGQGYCAQSEDLLQASCANAPSCNGSYGTCPLGTFCFQNVICEAIQQKEPPPIPTASPIDECSNLCLTPIEASDCDYVTSLGLDILPCSSIPTVNGVEVPVDGLCSGTGQCGTSLLLNNCPANKDLYLRLESSMCVEAGLGTSGIIPPMGKDKDTSENTTGDVLVSDIGTGDTTTKESEFIGSNGNGSVREESSNEEAFNWGETSPGGEVNDDMEDKSLDIDGWWLQRESSGRAGSGDGRLHLLIMGLSLIVPLLVR